ncbi:MAG: hypothetical protein AAGB06_06640, partial [Verrucomicrobiota bacterium]
GGSIARDQKASTLSGIAASWGWIPLSIPDDDQVDLRDVCPIPSTPSVSLRHAQDVPMRRHSHTLWLD